jgi:hypothetical protein
MNKMNLKYGLVALAGLGLSANVSATDLTCSDITFSPEAFAAYEFIDQACLDMVERDGGVWAKLTARVDAQTSSGTHFRYRHSDGELGPSNKAALRADFQTAIDGAAVRISDVAVRSDVNVYIGSAYWSVPPVEVAEVTEAAPPPPPPPPPPPAPEPEPEPEPEMLPTTASSLPLLALFGSLLLVLGGALRLSRR